MAAVHPLRTPEHMRMLREARFGKCYSTEPFRKAFLASGLSAGQVALRLGWVARKGHGQGDGPRVTRTLGLRPDSISHGRPGQHRKFMSYEMAVRMAEAIGVDPWEVGL